MREWAQSVVRVALGRARAACEQRDQTHHFQLFVGRYMAPTDTVPSWRMLGEACGLDEKTARSRAETAARAFRGAMRDLMASEVGSAEQADDEIHALIALL